MAMPDFSFLQNQPGNTSFGDLAKGLAQGAQLGMNMQNMKLQQAAQQQQAVLQQQQLKNEQLKYATMELENAARLKFTNELGIRTAGVTDPLAKTRIATGLAAELGMPVETTQFAQATTALRPEKAEMPKKVTFTTTNKEGESIEVDTLPVGGEAVDKRLEALGIYAPGHAYVSAGGKPKANAIVEVVKALQQKQGSEIITDLVKGQSKDIQAEAAAAESMETALEDFRTAHESGDQVLFPQTVEKMGAALNAMGADIDMSKLGVGNRAQGNVAFAYMKMLGGNDATKELGIAFDQGPAMWIDPKSREIILQSMEAAKDRKLAARTERDKFLLQTLQDGGQPGFALKDGTTWTTRWQEYKKAHPLASRGDAEYLKNKSRSIQKSVAELPKIVQWATAKDGTSLGKNAEGQWYNLDTGAKVMEKK